MLWCYGVSGRAVVLVVVLTWFIRVVGGGGVRVGGVGVLLC